MTEAFGWRSSEERNERDTSGCGGVFDHLSGTASACTVLEAMIAHSDNTATDAAMRRVGVDNVRAFLLKAKLTTLRSWVR